MALALTPGNVADISMAAPLIEALPPSIRLIADKGYDANHFRDLLETRGTEAVIPSTASRKTPIPFDRIAYRERNLIERMFGRLKDFRRIATPIRQTRQKLPRCHGNRCSRHLGD